MEQSQLRRGYFYAALTVAVWSGFILVSRLGGKSPLTGWDVTALRFGTAALGRKSPDGSRLRRSGPIACLPAVDR